MIKIWNWIKRNPNRAMFLVPIILVAAISISHVVTWYDMANPINWAIYLSVAIEIAAMTALVAVDSRIKGGVWFMFGLVTLIQVIGNVFYCFKEIDANGELFKAWVELTSPVWALVGTEITDVVSLKRWLAFLEGGLLPIISLTSLHFFITYKKNEDEDIVDDKNKYFSSRNKEIEKIVESSSTEKKRPTPPPIPVDTPIAGQPLPSDDLISRVEENQKKLKEENKIIMSVPAGKKFNTPYPFSEEMKENIKKSDDDIIEEEQPVLNADNEELAEIIVNEEIEDLIEVEDMEISEEELDESMEEHQKEKEVEEARQKAEEWAQKEEEANIKFAEKKKNQKEKEKIKRQQQLDKQKRKIKEINDQNLQNNSQKNLKKKK